MTGRTANKGVGSAGPLPPERPSVWEIWGIPRTLSLLRTELLQNTNINVLLKAYFTTIFQIQSSGRVFWFFSPKAVNQNGQNKHRVIYTHIQATHNRGPSAWGPRTPGFVQNTCGWGERACVCRHLPGSTGHTEALGPKEVEDSCVHHFRAPQEFSRTAHVSNMCFLRVLGILELRPLDSWPRHRVSP